MRVSQVLAKLPIFPLLITLSLLVGWFVPAFYDWTGSDQSRPSPLILPTALGLILCGIVACLALPWLPIATDPPTNDLVDKAQFKLRTILVITSFVAVIIASLRTMPMLAVSGVLYGLALCWVVRFGLLHHQFRWPVVSLLACAYFPYVWIVSFGSTSNFQPELLWMASGLPAFLPTILFSGLVEQHPQDLGWLSILMVSIELVIGVWIIRLGPKRSIAYFVFLLITSILGSAALNALVRM